MNLIGKKKMVVVGMSGGVDSSLAAAIAKKQGHHVVGVFMKNWDETDPNGNCIASKEFEDVVAVCDQLDIPYYSVDFTKQYRENVFKYFIEEYKQGYTPNPDILCNREIKFKVFFDMAMKLGADYLATGHYCQIKKWSSQGEDRYSLTRGQDPGKDQSYFLYAIQEKVLNRVLFPIGHLLKPEVRKMAAELNLSTHNKKDSTGICFIGERNFTQFIGQYIKSTPGPFKTLDGKIVGKHQGTSFYTIGQRKGIGLGGPGAPWFVVGKDIQKNEVYVERGLDHPALFADELYASELSWINHPSQINLPMKLTAKIRYRQKDVSCQVLPLEDGRLKVLFDQPQRAITPRQSIVFYQEDTCLGGAVIDHAGPNYFEKDLSLPPSLAL